MLRSISLNLLLICIIVLINGCTSKEIYSTAMDYNRNKAGLVEKSKDFEFGKISYLENTVNNLPTLVLLHGFGENKDNWNEFVIALGNKYHVIVPDLAGHGESVSSLTLNYSLEEHAKRLKKFLLAKNIKKVHLIGNSMGGGVALMYTSMFATDVNSLTLMDSIGLVQTKSEMMLYIEKTKDNPFFDVCTIDAYNELLSYALEKKLNVPEFIKEALMKEKCQNSKIDKYMFTALLQNLDNLKEVAEGISRPTLIIWGDKDKILHVDNAKLFHKYIKNSKLVVLKGIGHMPMLESATKSAKVFNDFIK